MEKNNKLLTIIILIIIVGVSLLAYVALKEIRLDTGGRSSTQQSSYGDNVTNTNSATTTNDRLVATSTDSSLGDANYIVAGSASTTEEFAISTGNNMTITLFMSSSTTPPTFQAQYFYTNDTVASTTGWYAETADATSGGITTHSYPVYHKLTYASSSEYYVLNMPDIRARKFKIEYTVLNANADVQLDVNYN